MAKRRKKASKGGRARTPRRSRSTAVIPADMVAELGTFDKAAERLSAAFVKALEAKPPPTMIYHYTNDAGLRGILESGKIWLTDVFSLNDPSELSHGFSQAIDIMKRRAADGPPETKTFAQIVEAFGTQGGLRAVAHYFTCSLSSDGDDLGQWRAYGDDGRGYSIGFDTKMFEDGFVRDSSPGHWSNSTFWVTYDDAQLVELQGQIVDSMFRLISLPRGRDLESAVMHAYMDNLEVSYLLHAVRTVLFFKHEAYANEKEYRLLQIDRAGKTRPPVVKYRSRPYRLIRYREFDWRSQSKVALKSIMVGPAADKPKAAVFANDCLRAFHRSPVEMTESKIPYRP
jgi:hypothetical protein